MTTKNYLCFVLICSVLFGCVSVSNTPPVATVTQNPLPTSTRTPLATATFTLTPQEASTQLPTLESAQAEKEIKKLLWSNPDCLAPCFMDIVPGQTSLDEASAMFAHLGLDLEQTTPQNYAASYKFDSGLSVRVRLHTQGGIIKSLDMPVTLPQDQGSSARQEWLTYLPETLIQQYGSPSKVNFFVGRGSTPSYAMDMYYDANDLIIEYYSYDLGKELQICPITDSFTSIRLWIGKNPVSPPADTVSLEKVTTMTIEEFSSLITGNPINSCFNLKAETFP